MNKSAVFADFERKYNGTYVFANPNGPFELFHLTVGQDEQLVFENEDSGRFTSYFGGSVEIQIKYPRCGYFEYNGIPYLVLKNPQRQYKRGICTGNHLIAMANRHPIKNGPWSARLVSASFGELTGSFKERIEIAKKNKPVVLNRNLFWDGAQFFFRGTPLFDRKFDEVIALC